MKQPHDEAYHAILKLSIRALSLKLVRCMMSLLNRQWIYSIHQNCFLYWKMVWQTCIAEAINTLQKKFGENSVKRNNEELMNMRSLELQFYLSNYVISR